MQLLYSGVSRQATVLAEYAAVPGNFAAAVAGLLAKASAAEGKTTTTVDHHLFSFLTANGFTFFVVCEEAVGRAVPNSFLERLQNEFMQKYGDKGRTAAANSLTGSFGKSIKNLLDSTNSNPGEASKLTSVQKKVDEVKNIMSDNIEKVLARGEKLETLVDKTDSLMFEADRFQRQGRALRRKMWWQSCKMKLVLILVVILAVMVIFLLACFAGGKNCVASNKKRIAHYTQHHPSPAPLNQTSSG